MLGVRKKRVWLPAPFLIHFVLQAGRAIAVSSFSKGHCGVSAKGHPSLGHSGVPSHGHDGVRSLSEPNANAAMANKPIVVKIMSLFFMVSSFKFKLWH